LQQRVLAQMAELKVLGSAEQASDEMWGAALREFALGDTIGYGRDDTLIRRGIHRATGKTICFKVIPTRSEQRRCEALREAEMLAAAKHANSVEFISAFQSRSELCIVTELCESDMLDKINSQGYYEEEDARLLFRDILCGLKHCHEQGIAHRDVKLDNIFQSPDGSLKLGDFGFAVRYKPGEILYNSCGTLSYAAPELLKPRGHVQCRPEASDVWSAGVVLYALCTGRLPFHGEDDTALIAQIRSGYWSAPRNLSDSLRDLLRKMLSIDPTNRPTFSDLLRHKWLRASELKRADSWSMLASQLPVSAGPAGGPRSAVMCAAEMKKPSFFKKHFMRLLVQN